MAQKGSAAARGKVPPGQNKGISDAELDALQESVGRDGGTQDEVLQGMSDDDLLEQVGDVQPDATPTAAMPLEDVVARPAPRQARQTAPAKPEMKFVPAPATDALASVPVDTSDLVQEDPQFTQEEVATATVRSPDPRPTGQEVEVRQTPQVGREYRPLGHELNPQSQAVQVNVTRQTTTDATVKPHRFQVVDLEDAVQDEQGPVNPIESVEDVVAQLQAWYGGLSWNGASGYVNINSHYAELLMFYARGRVIPTSIPPFRHLGLSGRAGKQVPLTVIDVSTDDNLDQPDLTVMWGVDEGDPMVHTLVLLPHSLTLPTR